MHAPALTVFETALVTVTATVSVTIQDKKWLGPQPPPPPRQGGEHVFFFMSGKESVGALVALSILSTEERDMMLMGTSCLSGAFSLR